MYVCNCKYDKGWNVGNEILVFCITEVHQCNYTIIMNIDECVWHPWHCFASRSWPTIHMNLPHLSSLMPKKDYYEHMWDNDDDNKMLLYALLTHTVNAKPFR